MYLKNKFSKLGVLKENPASTDAATKALPNAWLWLCARMSVANQNGGQEKLRKTLKK